MSKFLPAVVVADSLRELDVPVDALLKDFAAVTAAGVERLTSFQHADGGWGWFCKDATQNFMSAYVVYGLNRARRAGIAVDPQVVERGVAYLTRALPAEEDPNMQAYLHFALASAGAPQTEAARALAAEPAALGSYAQALLTLALQRGGAEAEARALLDALAAGALAADGLVHFETPQWFYKWEDVSIETTAYALKAFVELEPGHPLVAPIAAWLLAQRRGGRWKTTKDSAAAIFGLIEVATRAEGSLAFAKTDAPAAGPAREALRRRFQVVLNGAHTEEVVLDLNNPGASRFHCRFPPEALRPGANQVALRGPFDRRIPSLACETTLRYVSPAAELAPEQAGLRVSSHWSRRPTALRVGDDVEVTLIVATEAAVDYVMLSSPIPAGAVLVRGSGQGTFAELEERHERALLFVTHLEPGEHRLRHRFRCVFPGTYRVPPPHAELMYNPAIRGSGSSRRAHIAER